MDEKRSLHVEGLIDTHPSRVLRGAGAPMNILPDGKYQVEEIGNCTENAQIIEFTW